MTSATLPEKSLLVLAKGFPPDLGGVETYSLEVARAYAREGYHVSVITSHSGPARHYELDRIQICNVGLGSQIHTAFGMLRELWAIKARQSSFLLVHATTWRAALPALILWPSLPMVTSLHGREFLATRNVVLRKVMMAVYTHSRNLLVISRYSADMCLQAFPRLRTKALIAWNGASSWAVEVGARRDYHLKDGDEPKSLTVVCAARLVERKNIERAIAGFSRAALRHPGMNLMVAGDGPQRAELQQRVADSLMSPRIKFLGHIQGLELRRLFETADVLLHPHSHDHDQNDIESFCLTIADGMAAGLGVISGRDGAPSEYIVDGLSGLLVNGQSIGAIEDALSFMYLNPVLRGQMGRRAHEFACSNFHWAKHVAPIIAKCLQ